MLIFFIVTASFIKEAGIDVNRPDAPTAVSIADANILIAISSNDEIWIDRRLIDPRAVRPNIERLHAENPKGSIVIQADRSARSRARPATATSKCFAPTFGRATSFATMQLGCCSSRRAVLCV